MNDEIKPVKILLVEDSPGDIELTGMALKAFKIPTKLSVVTDGEEALDYLYKRGAHIAAETPDMILLDINIPKQNGQEVLSIIKKDEALKHIPVIVLTSSDADRDISKSYELHANCYIIKPLDVENYFLVVKCVEDFWLSTVVLPSQKQGK